MLATQCDKVEVRRIRHGMDGLFATSDIPKGDTIFLEDISLCYEPKPEYEGLDSALMMSVQILENPDQLNLLNSLKLSPNLWKRKPDKGAKTILRHTSDHLGVPFKKVMDIYNIVCAYNIRTYFIFDFGYSSRIIDRSYISPYMVKVNHSCTPNAILHPYNKEEEIDQQVVGLSALTDIKSGDEICFSYLPSFIADEDAPPEVQNEHRRLLQAETQKEHEFATLESDVKERRQSLRKEYGFICTCPRCSSEMV